MVMDRHEETNTGVHKISFKVTLSSCTNAEKITIHSQIPDLNLLAYKIGSNDKL
jgi:hypothetical protein